MNLVEQHIIEKGDPRWAKLSEAAFASKNLWNAANYLVRQSFIFQGTYLDNVKVFHLIKFHEAYQALPRKISNQVLIQLHQAWKAFFEALEESLIIGKNPFWKQEVEMGRKKNQEFVQIPHARFIEILTYKAALRGVTVILTEESYTSKASFLDRDELPTYAPDRKEEPQFSGRRDGRWYRASGKRLMHADVNGSYNIARKVFPTAFDGLGIAAPAVRPRRLAV